ncbi:hypothetical protein OCU04_011924 [Sclerotinia nivalis]|uniref:Cytochrome b5 heme-binding domain-containing protein n=1 Tax=Sclerotinia nivalis TaxID=352851 RepID=A0A9X0DDM6_9HELO|nr:hypothetical protein OCU04_011924 [Sclerotinia nivalis]
MVLLGLGLLIASVSFLCYKHSPATWWVFLGRLRPLAGIRDAGKGEDVGPGSIGVDEGIKKDGGGGGSGGKDSSRSLYNEATTLENEENTKVEKSTNAPSLQITEPLQDAMTIENKSMPPPIIPPPSKAALDRAAMPPPQPLFKKPALPNQRPSSPTTPRANASQPSPNTNIPSFSLDDANASSEEPEIPSFPAANSAQRASGGTRAIPRLNAFPTGTTSLAAPSRGPLPNRSPLPNRTPTSLTSPSLAPPPTHTTIPLKPRKKVLLTPNHSPLDWARLTSSPTSNLRGLPPSTPYLRVPPSLLKQFTGRKGKDAWTVLGGKVYNITPYLPYHPGGEPELMKCAGRDGTRLFGEVEVEE